MRLPVWPRPIGSFEFASSINFSAPKVFAPESRLI
ncbi:hypothetical protein Q669_25345 [Labrenzia sp. C1B10]|nr:hypothetical protein Q669_25345 [Labrenzia sp. C1B10]ERS09009.1 hypothetical protein Q675_16510 [Labrenzia sp. C1B70]